MFKGPVYQSWKEPPQPSLHKKKKPNRALPQGQSWVSHNGRKQRIRHLRNLCRPVFALTDPESVAAREAVRLATAGEPEPEYGMLGLMFAALEAANGAGVTWADSMNYILEKFEGFSSAEDK